MSQRFPHFILPSRLARTLCLSAAALIVAGCASTGSSVKNNYQTEDFNSTDTHTRTFEATEAQTCEAARRALLSQGYLIGANDAGLVSGKKAFQPDADVHLEIDFRVVCAKDNGGKQVAGKPRTIAFVSALQDRYSLKKINNSASVGVSVIGSVSLPYSQTDDSLVKVASQTVTDEKFYERFFKIVDRYLALDAPEPAPPVAMPVAPQVFPEQAAPGATPPANRASVAEVAPLAPLPPLQPEATAASPQDSAPSTASTNSSMPSTTAAPQRIDNPAPSTPTRSVAGTLEPLGQPDTAPAKAAAAPSQSVSK
jgi:hypothetical protein